MASLPPPSPSPVRFGVLGCADIAKKYIRSMDFLPHVTLAAIASRNIDKAKKFSDELGLPEKYNVQLYGSYEDLLDDPHVDAVYIPLPTSLHVEWVEKATKKGKHVLLEKPPSLNVDDLEKILGFCKEKNLQFMDGTMWMHNPRTQKMKEILENKEGFGDVTRINSSFFFHGDENFLKNDIRVKKGLDSLGCLGDLGWYCIRAVLWGKNFELPKKVLAQIAPKLNEEGVLINFGASLFFSDNSVAFFDCGFDGHWRQDLVFSGPKGILRLNDFCIPNREDLSIFEVSKNGGLSDYATKVTTEEITCEVPLSIPQEAALLETFAENVRKIRDEGGSPDEKWPNMTKVTQIVLNAVLESMEKGFVPITVDL